MKITILGMSANKRHKTKFNYWYYENSAGKERITED